MLMLWFRILFKIITLTNQNVNFITYDLILIISSDVYVYLVIELEFGM